MTIPYSCIEWAGLGLHVSFACGVSLSCLAPRRTVFLIFLFFKYRFRSTGLMRILVLSGMLRILKIPDSASSLAREENQTGFNCFDTKATVPRWCFISPWDLQNIYILKKCLKRCNNTTACIRHFTGVSVKIVVTTKVVAQLWGISGNCQGELTSFWGFYMCWPFFKV